MIKKIIFTSLLSLCVVSALIAQVGFSGGLSSAGSGSGGGGGITFPASMNGGTKVGGLGTDGYAQFTNSINSSLDRMYFGPQTANGTVLVFNPSFVSISDGALNANADLRIRTLYAVGGGLVLNSNSVTGVTFSSTSASVSSGFGTSPSILGISGSTAFQLTIGSGGIATTGVLTLAPTATNGWVCSVNDITAANQTTRQTAYTTGSATITTTAAWVAGNQLLIKCAAF